MGKTVKRTGLCVLVFALAFCVLSCVRGVYAASGTMTITAIDLGAENTGEAAMITAGDGGALLVDSGDNHNKAIFKWLDANGYKKKKFNTLVTHWHDDHAGNTAEIIRKYNVGTVYIPSLSYLNVKDDLEYYKYEKSYATDILAAARERGTKVVYLKKGQSIGVGSGVSGKVLYINGSPYSENWYNVQYINNQSAVIMFSGGGCKYLTAGDIQSQAEKRVLSSGQSIKADIFKLSHHGNIRSNRQDFLDAVDPTYAYFTSYKSTPNTYITSDTRDSVSRAGKISNVFGTRYNGTIKFVCSGGKVKVSAARNTYAMYQKLTNKSTGRTTTEKMIFNKRCYVRHLDRIIDTGSNYNQQVTAGGSMFTGSWVKISGHWYLRDSSGMFAYNTLAVKKGKYYYFGLKGQRYEGGWKTIRNSKYYFAPHRIQGFRKIGGKVYYFMNEKYAAYKAADLGKMLTGFKTVNGNRYYLIDSRYKGYKSSLLGVMATGWTTVGSSRYYMSSGGVIRKGMKKISGSYYYFSPSGVMQTGFVDIGKDLYYFDKDGKRVSGWLTVGEKKYYFEQNGKALKDIDKTIENGRYRFDRNGVMIRQINCHLDENGDPITGWHEIDGKRYYAFEDGELATGKVVIDGTEYEFDTVENGCALLTKDTAEDPSEGSTAGDTATETAQPEEGTEPGAAGPDPGEESTGDETEDAAEGMTENSAEGETQSETEDDAETGTQEETGEPDEGSEESTEDSPIESGEPEENDSSAEGDKGNDEDNSEEIGTDEENPGPEDASQYNLMGETEDAESAQNGPIEQGESAGSDR